ncbi:TetR/AcrR family transcriptional regulator [Agromyces sp. LHK192]|uniref:TetR/AcrR family transcriptional regulator n=1 Tax=Agromyces sp. LHK192 TaxID=2498704 RepID=UPI0013E2CA17|nr:TetR family transcriptional regulator C-terminal domain-containing protein [Agromyces sp. LHK192]
MTRIPAPERRHALIEAALRVVARDGIAQATTRAIVAEAGMSLASFHYAFESRDEMLDELIRTVVEREQSALNPPMDPGVSLRDRIAHGLHLYFDHLRADPDHERVMLELTQYALRDPERRPLAVAQYARYRALAAGALERGIAGSGSRWRVPVEQVAQALVAMTDGLTMTWLVDRDDAAAGRFIAAAADTIAGMAEDA